MERFGTLSFGHYGPLGGGHSLSARDSMLQAIELAEGLDELGVNGIYFRVHHFARQQSSPMPLLAAIAARTKRIEMGTGVIDMRYENGLYLAEEAAALDLISGGRLALGVSRGSPESVVKGYEAFGYTGGQDPRGADIARDHFATFMNAIDGNGIAERDSGSPFGGGTGKQRIEPYSEGLRSRVWWGAGTRETAEWAGEMGVNLMSSTLLTEDRGMPFDELQAEQIDAFRAAWKAAGHEGTPRTSVSRSIFPIVTAEDELYFGGRTEGEGVGYIDGFRSTFGKTYAAAPDVLVEQLKQDAAVASADTLMLTIPSQLGAAFNLHVAEAFATYVAPELGWKPTTEDLIGQRADGAAERLGGQALGRSLRGTRTSRAAAADRPDREASVRHRDPNSANTTTASRQRSRHSEALGQSGAKAPQTATGREHQGGGWTKRRARATLKRLRQRPARASRQRLDEAHRPRGTARPAVSVTEAACGRFR